MKHIDIENIYSLSNIQAVLDNSPSATAGENKKKNSELR
jgi:hypothetical protein